MHVGDRITSAASKMQCKVNHTLWKFQSLDEVKTLVYMEVYILNRCLSLEESFILNIVED